MEDLLEVPDLGHPRSGDLKRRKSQHDLNDLFYERFWNHQDQSRMLGTRCLC